jgi:hypothetical protein
MDRADSPMYSKLTEFLEDEQTQCFVRKEVLNEYSNGNGRRTTYIHEVWKLDKFRAYLETGVAEMYYNEMYLADHPCRLFIDSEYEKITNKQQLVAFVRDMIERIRRKLYEVYQVSDIGVVHIFNASLFPQKVSVHVTFQDIWFACPLACKAFLDGLFTREEIDFLCYAKSPKSLRLPYNVKPHARNRPLLPLSLDGEEISPKFDWERMINASVAMQLCPTERRLLGDPLPPGKIKTITTTTTTSLKMSSTTPVPPYLAQYVSDVLDYLRVIFQTKFRVDDVRWTENNTCWQCTIVDEKLFCPLRAKRSEGDGHHVQNKSMFIGGDTISRVYMYCPGEGCRERVYFPEDFSLLLM